ncbi:NifB/NifX family molybdenum-iron cluster-binding protein [Amphritea sp.]|uniref:NifB/NifX family molybdenum-iron cluster-binding protein n=1 Tax=Amphritea sp. TaxID=1872502 RepID=UPI003D10793C
MTECLAYSSIADAVTNYEDLIVAFASMEGDMVDQHFGSAQGFFVYSVNSHSASLLASQSFAAAAQDGNEDKLKPKLKWLVGADLVYCGSIGGSATRQLISLGITPVQVKGGPDVDELLDSIQAQLRGEKAFWLQNIINQKGRQSTDGFAITADEDWDE